MHQRGGGHACRLAGRERAEQEMIHDQHVRWCAAQLGHDVVGPGRRPGKRRHVGNRACEPPRCPPERETARRRRHVEGVRVGLHERDECRAGGRDALAEAVADRQSDRSDVRPSEDSHLVSACYQLSGNRQDEGDVSASLEHREQEAGRLAPQRRACCHDRRSFMSACVGCASILAATKRKEAEVLHSAVANVTNSYECIIWRRPRRDRHGGRQTVHWSAGRVRSTPSCRPGPCRASSRQHQGTFREHASNLVIRGSATFQAVTW